MPRMRVTFARNPACVILLGGCVARPRGLTIHDIRLAAVPDEEKHMAWTKPVLKEIACGMEINMYAPAEDEPVLF